MFVDAETESQRLSACAVTLRVQWGDEYKGLVHCGYPRDVRCVFHLWAPCWGARDRKREFWPQAHLLSQQTCKPGGRPSSALYFSLYIFPIGVKKLFFILCVCSWGFVQHPCAWYLEIRRGLQIHVWALGIKLRSSAREVDSLLNHLSSPCSYILIA